MSKKNQDKTRLWNNLLKVVQQFMSGRGYVPHSLSELSTRLGLPQQHFTLLHEILSYGTHEGIFALSTGKYALAVSKDEVVKGVVSAHPRGFGFVQCEDKVKYPQDIFIPKHLMKNAVDGDAVEVVVNTDSVSEKGPEGKIVAILSRSRTHMGGIIRAVEHDGTVIAYVPLLGLGQRVIVQSDMTEDLQVGDRIVMEVIDWGSKETETLCKLSHSIGNISDPSCDIAAAIEQYELRSDFPHNVLEEAESFGNKVTALEIKGREDLRDLECFTVDPDTAKDFDDALSVTKSKNGHYHLGVHIADVSHYVRPGSALDKEAALRCNSTYFPGTCIPMLPRELSENLCSLRANVNRLTVSVLMEFDSNGDLVKYRIARTVIKSAKRFSYREAKLVLDGKRKSQHLPTLLLMVELCGHLKRKRYERGSIEFSLPDLALIVDPQGVPQKIDYITYDITHQFVEEFMLKANELVALHLSQKGKNVTYRVHDQPAEENLKDFAALARAFGFHLTEKPSPQEIQALFEEALTSVYGQYLATSYIRSMRLAIYSADNIGHYGLGLTHYCHFTSPIRRYIDLVVHRILFGEDDNRQSLEKVSHACSEQERISAKAENSVVLLKKLRLLKQYQDLEPAREYEAVITRIKNFGCFFEVIEFLIEGFLHISELGDDYYIFEEGAMRMRGRHSGQTFCSGDRIKVVLDRINFITLESSWYRSLEGSERNRRQLPSKKHKKHEFRRSKDRIKRRAEQQPTALEEIPREKTRKKGREKVKKKQPEKAIDRRPKKEVPKKAPEKVAEKIPKSASKKAAKSISKGTAKDKQPKKVTPKKKRIATSRAKIKEKQVKAVIKKKQNKVIKAKKRNSPK